MPDGFTKITIATNFHSMKLILNLNLQKPYLVLTYATLFHASLSVNQLMIKFYYVKWNIN